MGPPDAERGPRQAPVRSVLARQSITDARNHTAGVCRCDEITFEDLQAVAVYNRRLDAHTEWPLRIHLPHACANFRRRRIELHQLVLTEIGALIDEALADGSATAISAAVWNIPDVLRPSSRDLLSSMIEPAS